MKISKEYFLQLLNSTKSCYAKDIIDEMPNINDFSNDIIG